MKFIIYLILLFNNIYGFAKILQSSEILYKGYVYDSSTNKPVSNAKITISKTISKYNISTDDTGYFTARITIKATDKLKSMSVIISHPLYKTKTEIRPIQPDVPDKFYLVKQPISENKEVNKIKTVSKRSNTITLTTILFDSLSNKSIINAKVFINEAQAISNNSGYVRLEINNPTSNSVFVQIQEPSLGISYGKLYNKNKFPSVIKLIVRDKIGGVNDEKVTTNGNFIDNEDFIFAIKSMLLKVKFNSSIEQILSYEFNKSDMIFDYEKLPEAIECSNDSSIRYYWRYVQDSRMFQEIYSYLHSHNLDQLVTIGSYIIYYFKNNKLMAVGLRIIPSSKDFDKLFFGCLTENKLEYQSHVQSSFNGVHYIFGSSFTDYKYSEIVINNQVGYESCIHDWWYID
ncbi:carboxypeptidase-like regulatory domain-containing protein [Flavobacterium sp. RHBU_24]|uniref:carboxypeptidase-like regulatory domain-containing protein n=1 Tax=Flavobacterium sp. RHBU_24 TaxID=3391185 RepID=UPI003984BB46